MSNKIINELDPIYEIMGLNFVSYHLNEIKQETKKNISDLGYDGERIYSHNFQIFDEYTQTFQKNMIAKSEKEFYFIESDYFFLILLLIVLDTKDEINSVNDLSDELIFYRIIEICNEVFDKNENVKEIKSTEDIILFLEHCNLEGSAKWKLLQIMQQPLKHILQLNGIIQSDMEAYKKAVKSVKSPLEKLLRQYEIDMNNSNEKKFIEIKNKFANFAETYPSLIFPATQMFCEKNCYYGLLSNKLTKNEKGYSQTKEELLSKLKALSDSSKLEIILSLKEKPMYNLEIAKKLGLTAATMSHHMNVLLYCGFVNIEKKEGKVYYSLQEESFKTFINELEKILL